MEKFALIWLIVIAAIFVAVLVAGGSPIVGVVAAGVLIAAFFGLRRIRRQRQELNIVDPNADEPVEPRPGEEPLRPG